MDGGMEGSKLLKVWWAGRIEFPGILLFVSSGALLFDFF